MAICTWCDQEMTTGASCSVTEFHRDGVPFALPPYRRGRYDGPRCGDCGVTTGGSHHPGCDMARCPACFGQLFGCGCRFDEDGPDDDEVDEW